VIPARFLPEAAAEFEEAARFYEAAQPGLGRVFAEEIERAVDRVTRFPESGSPLGTTVRAALVRNFPFWVVYRASALEAVILAVAHQRRRPGYWRRRKDAPR
jgi:plasmid stabilization system protein ParE